MWGMRSNIYVGGGFGGEEVKNQIGTSRYGFWIVEVNHLFVTNGLPKISVVIRA